MRVPVERRLRALRFGRGVVAQSLPPFIRHGGIKVRQQHRATGCEGNRTQQPCYGGCRRRNARCKDERHRRPLRRPAPRHPVIDRIAPRRAISDTLSRQHFGPARHQPLQQRERLLPMARHALFFELGEAQQRHFLDGQQVDYAGEAVGEANRFADRCAAALGNDQLGQQEAAAHRWNRGRQHCLVRIDPVERRADALV